MLIKRSVYKDISAHLENDEITMLIGPRQAGKTTIMFALMDELVKKNIPFVYLNLDIEKDKQFFSTQEKLLEKIKFQIGDKNGYVLIDEIQRKENAGLFLKGLYDMKLPYKFIVTGSGSIELKEKIYESLAGRKRIFEVYPLNFYEFCDFKTDYKYSKKLIKYLKFDDELKNRLLFEYLTYGGYPKVVLATTISEKISILAEIYKSFVEKDIQILLGIEKSESLTNLLEIIASQNGRLTNISEISNTLNLSAITVKKYLWYLEKTYILDISRPYFKNVRKEITKSPIYYFVDLGLRNYLLNINNYESIQDKGFLFQNFIFNELKDKIKGTTITRKYWRTKDGAEVDIVLDTYPTPIPIEVKYTGKDIKSTKSLNSFVKKFNSDKYMVATPRLEYLDLVV